MWFFTRSSSSMETRKHPMKVLLKSVSHSSAIATDADGVDVSVGSRSRSSLQTKPKTILFVTNTGEYGGSEKHLLELMRRLVAPEVRLMILCLNKDLYTERLTPDEAARVEIVSCVEAPRSFWDWYRVFRNIRADVVVFVRAWLWCYAWYVPGAARLAGTRRCLSIAHLTPEPVHAKTDGVSMGHLLSLGRRAYHVLTRRISTYFDHPTVCVSDAVRDALIRDYRIPAKWTVTIHNGVALPEFRQHESRGLPIRTRLGLRHGEFLLVCIARLSQQKRIDVLLLALAKLAREGIPCKCVIVGDGPLRDDLLRKAHVLGLNKHVVFEGFKPEIRPYLQAATAFVLSSDNEGLPLALLEAMSFGLPCIVTNVGGNAEAITDYVHGLIVPAGSPEELAAAIRYLISHPRELAEMSRRSRAKAQENFDIEVQMANLKRVILT